MSCPPDEPTLRRFIGEIDALPPRPHHSSLLAHAARLVRDCDFRHALTRGGWYRPGGVIRPDGGRLADDLEVWAEGELADVGGEMADFLDRHAGDGLLVTRHSGKTHYFVAAYGAAAADYLQLEVEEIQEVLDRRLLDPANPPDDLADLAEPARPARVDAQPVGPPRYRFRRLTDMRRVVARQADPLGGPPPVTRFLAEWDGSRASARGHFSDHWVVAVREHQDRYRNSVLTASPVSRHGRKLRHFHWHPDARGTALAEQLHAFDRAAGYPAAWYFHLVAGAVTPHAVAYALAEDLRADYRYLADGDRQLLERWLAAPYSV